MRRRNSCMSMLNIRLNRPIPYYWSAVHWCLIRSTSKQSGQTVWWRNQMELSLPCYWPFVRGIPRSLSFEVFWDALNKRLSKQSWRWWFETPSPPLKRHFNASENRNIFCAVAMRHTQYCHQSSMYIFLLASRPFNSCGLFNERRWQNRHWIVILI